VPQREAVDGFSKESLSGEFAMPTAEEDTIISLVNGSCVSAFEADRSDLTDPRPTFVAVLTDPTKTTGNYRTTGSQQVALLAMIAKLIDYLYQEKATAYDNQLVMEIAFALKLLPELLPETALQRAKVTFSPIGTGIPSTLPQEKF